MTPKPFAALRKDDVARWSHEVTPDDVDAFVRLTGDDNPLHRDARFCRQHGFRRPVVQGMLLGGFLSRVLGAQLPGPGVVWMSQSFRFIKPVYVGERIEVVIRIVHKSDLGALVLETKVLDPRGEVALTGEAKVMVLNQERHVPWTEMTAVVTGSSRGIGAGIAEALGKKKVRVVVNYRRDADAAGKVVEAVRSAGGDALAVQADVSTPEGGAQLAEAAIEKFGRVDVLVNNATPAIQRKAMLELSAEDLDVYWRTYVLGAFNLVRAVVPGMKERGFGRVINILTTAIHGTPPADLSGYLTAKSGLWGLTKAMAVELAPFGITVNAVSPSAVLTDQWDDSSDSRRRALAMKIPVRRLATPENVSEAVIFLAGNEAGYLTGVDLPVAGGEVM